MTVEVDIVLQDFDRDQRRNWKCNVHG